MITAKAVVDDNSCLVDLDVNGHAGYSIKGMDIVCSAATVLIRTAARLLMSEPDSGTDFEAGERGSFKLSVLGNRKGKREKIKTITEFLLRGLSDLEKEYPACIKLEITIDEEMIHGS